MRKPPPIPEWLAELPRLKLTPSPTIPGMWSAWQGISEHEARRIYASRQVTFSPPIPYREAVAEIKRMQSVLVAQYENGVWRDWRKGGPASGLQFRKIDVPFDRDR